jgi:CrcB protein|nr:MAG: putative fluoride ion transporter CrcB [Bacteroidota bacterium]
MRTLLWLGLAGALGTLARYALSGWTYRIFNGSFPWGTLAVNVLGSAVLGLLMGLSEGRMPISSDLRTALAIGFLGAFTTFSTFSYETLVLLQKALYLQGLSYIALNVLLGLGGVWLGYSIGRLL